MTVTSQIRGHVHETTGPMEDGAARPSSELRDAIKPVKTALIGIVLFSALINVLMLTGAFFMLQIYDRVLPSRSIATLIALAGLVAFLFLIQAMLDMIRSRILSRIASTLDAAISPRVFDTVLRLPLKATAPGDGLHPLRDLDAIRTFLTSQGPTALCDLPWVPIYLAIIFAFHPILGATALIGAIVLAGLTVFTELWSRDPMRAATEAANQRNGFAQAGRRNAEAVAAMGLGRRLTERWTMANDTHNDATRRVTDVAGGFGAMSRALRMFLQSAVLGVGAYFVIHGQATAGIIIAGSILAARALAPVDLAIANWRNLIAARQSWRRLGKLLSAVPAVSVTTELPAPSASLTIEGLGVVAPGKHDSIVHNLSFRLKAGEGLGVIGPSGSGKTSLARALVGVWQPARGAVRLDGAALTQWSPTTLGQHIGYLPQDSELFDGTVAENISRFEADASSSEIIKAATAAGAHDLITSLSDGYDTTLGEAGRTLSAGQRQRIALARALYREPFLVVLDEPNANLDSSGEAALNHAIRGIRNRGGIAIVIAHRKSAITEVDQLLVLQNGSAKAFGPRDEVLAHTLRAAVANAEPASPDPAAISPSRPPVATKVAS